MDIESLKAEMLYVVDALKAEFSRVRTGRAHAGLLESVRVSYYGNDTPLVQVASIVASDPRTLSITPWDKSVVPAIEKAILQSDLGLNPVTAGQVIRVPIPPMTEERRVSLVKLVRALAEKAKVSVRNIRREGNGLVKSQLKEKALSEDEAHRLETQIQKVTDGFVEEIALLLTAKEADLMTV